MAVAQLVEFLVVVSMGRALHSPNVACRAGFSRGLEAAAPKIPPIWRCLRLGRDSGLGPGGRGSSRFSHPVSLFALIERGGIEPMAECAVALPPPWPSDQGGGQSEGRPEGIEPSLSRPQREVLPLNYGRHDASASIATRTRRPRLMSRVLASSFGEGKCIAGPCCQRVSPEPICRTARRRRRRAVS